MGTEPAGELRASIEPSKQRPAQTSAGRHKDKSAAKARRHLLLLAGQHRGDPMDTRGFWLAKRLSEMLSASRRPRRRRLELEPAGSGRANQTGETKSGR
jgi:hypothetical protein